MELTSLVRLCIRSKIISFVEGQEYDKNLKEKGESIIFSLVKAKKRDYTQMAVFLSQSFQVPFMDLDFFDLNQMPEVDPKIMDKANFIPVKKTARGLYIAVSDPSNPVYNDLKFQLDVAVINLIVVEEDKLHKSLEKLIKDSGANFAQNLDFEGELDLIDDTPKEEAAPDSDVEDAPLVKFIHQTLVDAVKMKASDIHFEPYEKTYRVRFRQDGALFEYKTVPVALKEKIASRIKVVSSLDISEKRVPQDGRMKIKVSADRVIDFRVSTLPTLFGEKIVMRILDSSASALDIDKLGYDPIQKERLLEAVKRPYGMVLVTGPTGSGKTVSLYSCIHILNQPDVNICTAEDPSEINLPGVNQVNMNEKAGLTFAATLKSFLRQDPDTILVGEIRDLETADIAIKAAQTGHMVLSTLHTNDAPKTITRLLNMGVKPFNIASAVNLITAQRLARRLCPSCKEIDDVPEDIVLEAGLPVEELSGYKSSWHIYKPVGCEECGGKGYKGRVGIYQVMPITTGIRELILKPGSTDIDIAREAKNDGVLGLREAGMLKVKQGITSMAEVLATTNLD